MGPSFGTAADFDDDVRDHGPESDEPMARVSRLRLGNGCGTTLPVENYFLIYRASAHSKASLQMQHRRRRRATYDTFIKPPLGRESKPAK